MSQLFETIKIRHNTLLNLEYHTERVNYSRKDLYQSMDKWDLSRIISLPTLDNGLIYKCRFLYGQYADKIEFIPYLPSKVNKLYLVEANDINYSYKYTDRQQLQKLKNSIAADENSEIVIIKNSLITDTSFSNIVLFDGNKWYTPSTPLLKGTKRAYYLANSMIFECDITPDDLHKYRKARLINAMLDLEDSIDIPIDNILR